MSWIPDLVKIAPLLLLIGVSLTYSIKNAQLEHTISNMSTEINKLDYERTKLQNEIDERNAKIRRLEADVEQAKKHAQDSVNSFNARLAQMLVQGRENRKSLLKHTKEQITDKYMELQNKQNTIDAALEVFRAQLKEMD